MVRGGIPFLRKKDSRTLFAKENDGYPGVWAAYKGIGKMILTLNC